MNEYVQRVSAVDPLTGLASAAALRQRIDRLERECAPHGFGVVLVGIRGLSAYNQEHGYSAGDDLILAMARRLEHVTAVDAGAEYGSEVDCLARTGGGEFILLVRSRGGALSQFRRWLRITLEHEPVMVPGRKQVEFSSSFRAWTGGPRDLVWWVQDAHRHEERREVAMRLDALEKLMEASGHVVAEGVGLWERLQRAEGIARSDPNGSGALSRAGLDEAMATVSAPYAIAFVDLDGLRDFNAATGNWQAGDAALAALVRVLRTCARDTIVARWGGDEFLVVLPGLDGPTALDRMTRALHSEVRVSDLPLTFTAGVAAVATADGLQAATGAAKAAVRQLKDTGSRATVLLAGDPADVAALPESI